MAMDLERFAGRLAIVTGAAGGLGSVITEELVGAGINVAGLDIAEKPLKELAVRLSGSRGKVYPVVGDLSKEEDVTRMFRWIDDNLGGVSIIVNNAGRIYLERTDALEFKPTAEMINANVLGVVAACTNAIQSMKKHQITDGHIINVSSTAGHHHSIPRSWFERFHSGVYCATKHAVTGLGVALRAELRDLPGFDIRVTNLSPGTARTPLVTPETARILDGRMIQPKEIARAVRYALSCPPDVEVSELTIKAVRDVW